MIDMRLPSSVRDTLVLPADGNRILWIPGGRSNYDYMVDGSTRNVLELTVRGMVV